MRATTSRRTLRGTFARRLGWNALALSVALAGLLAVPSGGSAEPLSEWVGWEVLSEQHGCWTGLAPIDMAGRIPGHVVVTESGHTDPTYGGRRLVGLAMDQVLNGVDHGLAVHAFCR